MKHVSQTIHVIAPAGVVNKNNVKKGIKHLTSLGFSCISGTSLYDKEGSLAGTDTNRLADLQLALDDAKPDAIWIARGGYHR